MEAINWQAVHAISASLGSILVIGSLIFLGLEIRHSSKVTKAATMNNMMTSWADAYRAFSESENIGTIVWTGVQDPNKLSGAEQWRFSLQVAALFHNFQNAHYQWKLGLYDEASWLAQSNYLTNLMSLPGVQAVWDERKEMFSRDFRNYMETQTLNKSPDGNFRLAGT